MPDFRKGNAQTFDEDGSPLKLSAEKEFEVAAFYATNENLGFAVDLVASGFSDRYVYRVERRTAANGFLPSPPSGEFVMALTEDDRLISVSRNNTSGKLDVFVEQINANNTLTLVRSFSTVSVNTDFPYNSFIGGSGRRVKRTELIVEVRGDYLLIADPRQNAYDLYDRNQGGTDNYGRRGGANFNSSTSNFTDATLYKGAVIVGEPSSDRARIYSGTTVLKTISKPVSIASHSDFGESVFSDDETFGIASKATNLSGDGFNTVSFFENDPFNFIQPVAFQKTIDLAFYWRYGVMTRDHIFVAGNEAFAQNEGGVNNWGFLGEVESSPTFNPTVSGFGELQNGTGDNYFFTYRTDGRKSGPSWRYESKVYGNYPFPIVESTLPATGATTIAVDANITLELSKASDGRIWKHSNSG